MAIEQLPIEFSYRATAWFYVFRFVCRMRWDWLAHLMLNRTMFKMYVNGKFKKNLSFSHRGPR